MRGRSGYYAWLKRPPSDRKIEDNILSVEIKRITKNLMAPTLREE